MANNANNIAIGAGNLYIAPYGTAVPTIPADADAEFESLLVSPWFALGYTKDGISAPEYTPKVTDIYADQALAAVMTLLTGEEANLKTNLIENTLKNWAVAMSASSYSSTSATKQTLGVGGGTLTDYAIVYVGKKQADDSYKIVVLHKVRSIGTSGPKDTREGETVIPVTFKCLADSTKTAGSDLFQVYNLKSAA